MNSTDALAALAAVVHVECAWGRPAPLDDVAEVLDVQVEAAAHRVAQAERRGWLAASLDGWTATKAGHRWAPSLHAVLQRSERRALRAGACKPYIAAVASRVLDYMRSHDRAVTVQEMARAFGYSRHPVSAALAALRYEGAVDLLGHGRAARYVLTGVDDAGGREAPGGSDLSIASGPARQREVACG